jgi:hypothetical protein
MQEARGPRCTTLQKDKLDRDRDAAPWGRVRECMWASKKMEALGDFFLGAGEVLVGWRRSCLCVSGLRLSCSCRVPARSFACTLLLPQACFCFGGERTGVWVGEVCVELRAGVRACVRA